MKKCLIICLSFVLLLLCSCDKLNYSKKVSLLEYYFDGKDTSYIEELLYQDGQSVVIDDYTITLKEVLMESSVPVVYCRFIVEKEGQDMTKDEYEEGYEFFGSGEEDGRFRFFTAYEKNMGDAKFQFKATKKTLNVYGEFKLQPTENDITIYLYDRESGKSEEKLAENSSGEFTLKKKEKVKTYKYKDEEIMITPFRLVARSQTGLYCAKIEIYYKDGKKLLVRDGDNYENVSVNTFGKAEDNPYKSGYTNEYYCDLEFKKPINIENIHYICVNGEKLE